MQPTAEQQAITTYVRTSKGNLVVEALAGTGKTTAILQALTQMPQRSALVCAFNKQIATEITAKLPKLPPTTAVHVKTFHALGLKILQSKYPKLKIAKTATDDLIQRVAGGIPYKARYAAVKLLRVLKETCSLAAPPDADDLVELAWNHGCFDGLHDDMRRGRVDVDDIIDAVDRGYRASFMFETRESIDFCDMVWGAVVTGASPPSRYQIVFVDEFQDISRPQLAMVDKLIVPKTGRLVAIGDPRQQIYQFRGSLGAEAWAIARRDYQAKVLPLTTCFRCSEEVIKLAQEIVPEIKARPDAEIGSVTATTIGMLPTMLNVFTSVPGYVHTFVLSRSNHELLETGLKLWRARVSFQLNAGKEILDPVIKIVDVVGKMVGAGVVQADDTAGFENGLGKWYALERKNAESANATLSYMQTLEEHFLILKSALRYAKPSQIKKLLTQILVPNESGVLLSTVHKVKGLEADRVFLLQQTFGRHKPIGRAVVVAPTGSGETETFADPLDLADEELNVEYVAITRAKEHVIWVDLADARDLQDVVDQTDLDALSFEELTQLSVQIENETVRMSNDALRYVELDERRKRVVGALATRGGS